MTLIPGASACGSGVGPLGNKEGQSPRSRASEVQLRRLRERDDFSFVVIDSCQFWLAEPPVDPTSPQTPIDNQLRPHY